MGNGNGNGNGKVVPFVGGTPVRFLHAKIEDDNGQDVGFRYTAAYSVVAMEQKTPERDPCFVVSVGFAFCCEFADQFSRALGRELAVQRLQEHAMVIRLYPGSDLRYAIETRWITCTFVELMRMHVPRRIARWMRRSGRQPKSVRTPEQARRHRELAVFASGSRSVYNAALKAGKSHDEAVTAARTWAAKVK